MNFLFVESTVWIMWCPHTYHACQFLRKSKIKKYLIKEMLKIIASSLIKYFENVVKQLGFELYSKQYQIWCYIGLHKIIIIIILTLTLNKCIVDKNLLLRLVRTRSPSGSTLNVWFGEAASHWYLLGSTSK